MALLFLRFHVNSRKEGTVPMHVFLSKEDQSAITVIMIKINYYAIIVLFYKQNVNSRLTFYIDQIIYWNTVLFRKNVKTNVS